MQSVRKKYGFAGDVVETFVLGNPTGSFVDREGKSHDFTPQDLDLPDRIASALVTATARHCAVLVTPSATHAIKSIKNFADFLRDEQVPLTSLADLDIRVRKRYLLRKKADVANGLALGTVRKMFSVVEAILRNAFAFHDLYWKEIDRAFPGSSRSGKPTEALSNRVLRQILTAAKREVTEVWTTFENRSDTSTDDGLTAALDFVHKNWGGVMRPPQASDSSAYQRWMDVAQRGGGTERVSRHLHATMSSLIPYLILITYHTAGNIMAIVQLRRDCMHPDPLLDGSYTIKWWKGRSNSEQQVSRLDGHRFSAPVLIRQLAALTSPLLEYLHEGDRDLLFVCYQRGGIRALRRYGVALSAFLKRNGITEADGSDPLCTFQMMRPTVMNELYRRTGSIMHVSKLANHQNLVTTIKYLRERIVGSYLDSAIVRSQGRLMGAQARSAQPLEIRRDAPTIGRSRGVANDCNDVFGSPDNVRRASTLCPAWLWPLNDPGLIVPDLPRPVANLVKMKLAIERAERNMNAERFELVLRPALTIVAEILAKISPDTLAEAEWLAETLPPLPDLSQE